MEDGLPAEQKSLFASNVYPIKQIVPEGRLDWGHIRRCILMPWIVLTLIVLALSLKFRYFYPTLAIFCTFAVALCGLSIAAGDIRRAISVQQRRWAMYKMCSVCLACLFSSHMGEYCFRVYIKHYYDLGHMQRYKGVDPSTTHGAQVSDAGVLRFTEYTMLDRAQAGCYQTRSRFCVAPIVALPEGSIVPPTGSYDFFAVGKDCCDCPDQDFRCGDWDSTASPGGLRMIDEIDAPYYQLAVDQWSAAYRRTAKPLFFYWTSNAEGNLSGMYEMAGTEILLFIFGSLPVMAIFGVLAGFFIHRKERIPV